ncbi:MAG: zinc-binding dehydrogenase [Acidobacteria bacterium]|nr:zinc-binding dehydrogenase [Acidobacteriota bacterium]
MTTLPTDGLTLHSTIRADDSGGGTVELALVRVPVPEPGADQVVIRVEASPINPSDLGVLFGPADVSTVRASDGEDGPAVVADIPKGLARLVAGRLGQAIPTGNEGAGVVVAAGSSPAAQALIGRTVAVLGGSMYAEYRLAEVRQCLSLPEGTTPAEGASCFVNPLTALGMVETMRLEGHTALVHTAAASNLGQMLQNICTADGVPLVNVVRRPEHEELLRGIGASHVVNLSTETFMADLVAAIADTGATLGFDATGGGKLAGQILTAMEAALSANAPEYSRYGSATLKQVYIYGGLDRSQTVLTRNFGMAWGLGGWLLPHFLRRIGYEASERLRQRVAAEIRTTFASSYAKTVTLRQALDPASIAVYAKQATGEKYLVTPHG